MTMMPELPTCSRAWVMVDSKELFRRLLEAGMQELIDAELSAAISAVPHGRTDTRSNQRNGSRSRLVSTPAGDVELRIPKVRVGSFFPSPLEPRRRVDKAPWGVIMSAYTTGTSTRKVDDLVRALGCESGGVEVDGVADLRRDRRGGCRVPAQASTVASGPTLAGRSSKVLAKQVLSRLVDLRLDPAHPPVRYEGTTRGVESLHVTFTPGAPGGLTARGACLRGRPRVTPRW